MSGLLTTLLRTLVLQDPAYNDWRDRPNLFTRGLLLIVVVSLVAGLIGFAVSLVASVAPFDAEDLREEIKQSIEQSMEYNPGWDQMDPEARRYAESAIEDVVDMIADIASMKSPLPRGVAGFFEAVGGWLSRVPASLAGWMFYGVLVLVCVNLLGGSAKLGDFLGMVALYSIPGLLAIFNPLLSQVGVLSCLGSLLSIVVLIWSVVVYIKGTSVISGLDLGRATAAVLLPALAILVLGVLLLFALMIWLAIIF